MEKRLTIKGVLDYLRRTFGVDLSDLTPQEILDYFDGYGAFLFNESGSYHRSEEAFDVCDPRNVDVIFDPSIKEILADRVDQCEYGERLRAEYDGFNDYPEETNDGRLIAFLNLTERDLDLPQLLAISADLARSSATRITVSVDGCIFNETPLTVEVDETGDITFQGAMALPLDNRENFAFGIARGLELFCSADLDEMDRSGFLYEFDADRLDAFTMSENDFAHRYTLMRQNEPSKLRDKAFVLAHLAEYPRLVTYLDDDLKYDKEIFAEFMRHDMPMLAAFYGDYVSNDGIIVSHYGAIARNRENIVKGVVDDFARIFDTKRLAADLDLLRCLYDNYMLVNLFAPQDFDPALDDVLLTECPYYVRVVLGRNEDLLCDDKKLRDRYCTKYELDEQTDVSVLSVLKTLDDFMGREDFPRLISALVSRYSPVEYDAYEPFFAKLDRATREKLAESYLAFAYFFRTEIEPNGVLARKIATTCPHAGAILSDECKYLMKIPSEEAEDPITTYCVHCGECLDLDRPSWRLR